MTAYVFITGGVVSSLGKGITSACLGAIMSDENLAVLERAHRAGIHIDVRIQLDHADREAP